MSAEFAKTPFISQICLTHSYNFAFLGQSVIWPCFFYLDFCCQKRARIAANFQIFSGKSSVLGTLSILIVLEVAF
jgi:hypothetical protein